MKINKFNKKDIVKINFESTQGINILYEILNSEYEEKNDVIMYYITEISKYPKIYGVPGPYLILDEVSFRKKKLLKLIKNI